jgi:hypothetical protein
MSIDFIAARRALCDFKKPMIKRRTMMLKKCLFTLLLLIAFSLAAGESRAQLNTKGAGAWNDCVAEAYRLVFGRSASPQELGNWRKAGVDNSECGPEASEQVVAKLKASLRTPQGANELADTIRRSHEDSFGRAPKAAELSFWTTEIAGKQKNLGYKEMLDAHRQALKDDKNQSDRTYAIYQAYLNGIGRAPNPGDLDYWRNRMKQDGSNYTDCLKANAAYIAGNSADQVKERLETIKRAFATARLAPPTPEMQSQTSALIVKRKPIFKPLTELIIATFPKAQKQFNFPGPQK